MRLQGSGVQGFFVEVTEEGMALAEAVSHTGAHHVNHEHQECYTMDIDGIQTDGANYWLAIIKNTSEKDIVITSITGCVPSFKNDQIYEAYLGGTLVYASNGTAVVPINRTAGSGKTATGEFYVNDGAGNITTVVAGSIVGRYTFGVESSKWFEESDWIIPPGQCFMLWSNLAEKLTGYISFYYHD